MKLVEFQIHHYGPLEATGKVRPGRFVLFWGSNEDGKTLLLDALLRLLFGKQVVREMRDIERVAEPPDGYAVVELNEDTVVRFPDAGSLANQLNLPLADCLNLLVIRNSDLALAEESRFFDHVRDRLFNLNSARIEKLQSEILRLARITATGKFSNREEDGKLKERLERAQDLVAKLEDFAGNARARQLDRAELLLVEKQEQLAALQEEQKQMEAARQRERFEQGHRLLEQAKQNLKKLEELAAFTEQGYRRWETVEQDLRRLDQERQRLQEQIAVSQDSLKELREKLSEAETRLRRLEKEEQALEKALKPLADQKNLLETQLASALAWKRPLQGLMGAGGVVALLGLAGLLLRPSSLAQWCTAGGGLLLLATTLVYLIQLVRPQRRLRTLEVEIEQTLRPYLEETEAYQPGLVERLLRRQQERVEAARAARISAESRLRAEEALLQEREARLRDIASEEQQRRADLLQLQRESGVKTSEAFFGRLRERQALEMALQKIAARLQEKFGTTSEQLEENLPFWEQQLGRLSAYREAAPGVRYDEGREKAIDRDLEQLRSDIQALQDGLAGYRDQLRRLERDCQNVLRDFGEALLLRSLSDVQAAIDRLQAFCRKHQQQRQAAELACRLLSRIREQEKEKLQALFGPDQLLARTFREITGGLYTSVVYDVAQNGIQVLRRDGARLLPKQLSGGTYDQLYFAVRVALAQKLLAEQTGFFLLDDPFLKSDSRRLAQQLQMLLRLAEQGWQIVYFSAKKEVREQLARAIQDGTVQLIETQPPRFKQPQSASKSSPVSGQA
ncbi:MAG: hypothetical protein D6715_12340 [Calditrichaeota bacterium]|nr:MAG: hypothetical protein D6715_12340 [Calditrichota bacterium]